MIAKWFRFQKSDGLAWIGLVVAPTTEGVFWAIDEYGDPYGCDVINANFGGYCRLLRIDGEDTITLDTEGSASEPLMDDPRWKPAKWTMT